MNRIDRRLVIVLSGALLALGVSLVAYADNNEVSVCALGQSPNSAGTPISVYWMNGRKIPVNPMEPTNVGYTSIAVVGSDYYVGGANVNGKGVCVASYWKNGTRVGLPPLDPAQDSYVFSLTVTGSDVYAGGWSANSAGVRVAGYWKNGAWVGLAPLDAAHNSYVYALAVAGSDVYAGGWGNNGSGLSVGGYWKNRVWVAMPSLKPTLGSWVYSLAVVGSDVYAGGGRANDFGMGVAGYWKNGTWVGLPSLDSGKNSWLASLMRESGVTSLTVVGPDVYAGGWSENMSHVKIAGYWKNGAGVALPSLDSTHDSCVSALAAVGSDVYAGGWSTGSAGVKVAGYWTNDVWVGLSPVDANHDSQVNSLAIVSQETPPPPTWNPRILLLSSDVSYGYNGAVSTVATSIDFTISWNTVGDVASFRIHMTGAAARYIAPIEQPAYWTYRTLHIPCDLFGATTVTSVYVTAINSDGVESAPSNAIEIASPRRR